MQASLESEQRAKAEALRIKKKLEGEINELEIALDHANKANNEAQKSIKRYQGQFREAECAYAEESRVRQEMAEKKRLRRLWLMLLVLQMSFAQSKITPMAFQRQKDPWSLSLVNLKISLLKLMRMQ